MNKGMAFLGGLGLGAGIAVGVIFYLDRISSSEDCQKQLDSCQQALQLLGTLPTVSTDATQSRIVVDGFTPSA